MPRLEVPEAIARTTTYGHAIVSYVGADGYPRSVAGDFTADATAGVVEVGPITPEELPPDGREVCLTFSSIRPNPGQGYDQRRYVNLWGPGRTQDDRITIVPQRATGWDENETPFFEYSERSVPRGRRYLGKLGRRARLAPGWTFFLATRLPFLTATIVPVAVGGAVAAHHGFFSWGLFGLTMLAACCIHLALNVANDIFDDLSGADAANVTPTPFSGGSRVIQHGLVSRRAMVGMCVGFYAAGLGVGLWLAATRGWWLLAIGAAGLAISLTYTAPPFKLVHRGLGEPAVALGFGPVMTLGAYFVLAQRFSVEALYVSLPVALLIAMVLYVNEIPDRAGDAAAGKRTLVVRWPANRVIGGFAASTATAFALVAAGAATGLLPVWTLLVLLTAPMAVSVYRGLRRHYDQPYELMSPMQTNIGLHLFFGLLLVAGYVLALAVG